MQIESYWYCCVIDDHLLWWRLIVKLSFTFVQLLYLFCFIKHCFIWHFHFVAVIIFVGRLYRILILFAFRPLEYSERSAANWSINNETLVLVFFSLYYWGRSETGRNITRGCVCVGFQCEKAGGLWIKSDLNSCEAAMNIAFTKSTFTIRTEKLISAPFRLLNQILFGSKPNYNIGIPN